MLKYAKTADDAYVFECEEHTKRPKVQAKIDPGERKLYESNCLNLGLPSQCEDLPNGDVLIQTSARDKHGRRLTFITKHKDLFSK